MKRFTKRIFQAGVTAGTGMAMAAMLHVESHPSQERDAGTDRAIGHTAVAAPNTWDANDLNNLWEFPAIGIGVVAAVSESLEGIERRRQAREHAVRETVAATA